MNEVYDRYHAHHVIEHSLLAFWSVDLERTSREPHCSPEKALIVAIISD